MTVDSLKPVNDPRVSSCHADLNGNRYHYLLGVPKQGFKETVFLVHGWPDISIGWRNQIPMFLEAGYRVVVPDIMGFGGTDAPEDLSSYSFKRIADDIKELAHQLGSSHIILGGHDWGGAIVYRVILWHPELVTHVFAVCTPYWAPSPVNVDLAMAVKTKLPNLAYQLHLASGEVEKHIQTKEQIRQFLSALYGGKGPNGEIGFDTANGPLYENLPKLAPTRLLSPEMLDFYTEQYARNGIHSTLNWYRTRDVNFEEELELVKLDRRRIETPLLFIAATKDAALPPAMSAGMDEHCLQMVRKSVDTSHWALWEAPEQINSMVKEWLASQDKSRSSL